MSPTVKSCPLVVELVVELVVKLVVKLCSMCGKIGHKIVTAASSFELIFGVYNLESRFKCYGHVV